MDNKDAYIKHLENTIVNLNETDAVVRDCKN